MILGYNTAIYGDIGNKWQFDRVDDSSIAYYIKFNDKYFTYLQRVVNINDKYIDNVENDHTIIEEPMVYSSL